MKEKVSDAKKRLIRKDHKNGFTQGELSWKYNLTLARIIQITQLKSK